MPEEMITFELIRKIQRDEQNNPKLTKLPENFYEKVNAYLQQKRKTDERRSGLELKNIERLVEDIFNRRERKILNLVLISARTEIPPENLIDEEKQLFESVVNLIKERRENTLNKLLEGKKEEMEAMIVFREEVPQFVGSDMNSYGPFKKGDIAKLPQENMKIMIEQGVAEEFKVSK